MSIFTIVKLLNKDNSRNFYLGLILLSFFSLGSAYYVEYILHFPPCILCIYQRFPFLFLVMLSVSGLLIKKYNKYILFFIGITLVISTLLAGYHSGIERKIFEPTALCSASATSFSDELTINEIRNKIYNEDVATCSKAALKIFGLSMAEWNFFLNIGLLLLVILIYKERNYAKTQF